MSDVSRPRMQHDQVVVPNIPMMSVISQIKGYSFWTRKIIETAMRHELNPFKVCTLLHLD